jgi:ATP-dependent DNA helicase RecQ
MINYTDQLLYSKLKEFWGYDDFRPQQLEIIKSILNHSDTIGLLPTGGGKSLCFQLPALILPGYSLVISPLIALIKDQVGSLLKKNIKAAGLNYQMSVSEKKIVYDLCESGHLKLLYISPERLGNKGFLDFLKRCPPNMVVVDEAHCISQWGHDFRPAYLQIGKIKQYLDGMVIHAFTATADRKVLNDIKKYLDMKNVGVFRKSFRRENLAFRVYPTENKLRSLIQFYQQFKGSSIVYVRSRERTGQLAKKLIKSGINAFYYHAGLNVLDRAQIQEEWMFSDNAVMVSTNAFGMGVDKADVRSVVHFDLPEDLESYYQEAGRAGRDGDRSIALVLYNSRDIKQLKEKFDRVFPLPERVITFWKLLRSLLQSGSDELKLDADHRANFEAAGYSRADIFRYLKLLDKYEYCSFADRADFFGELNIINWHDEKLMDDNELYDFWNKLLEFLGRRRVIYKIDEYDLAEFLEIEVMNVQHALKLLTELKVIDYNPGNKNIEIRIIKQRAETKGLREYRQYRKVKLRKLNHIIDFVSLPMCRQIYILRYFGEAGSARCNQCDICVGAGNLRIRQRDIIKFRNLLNDNIGEKGIDIDDLMFNLPFFEQDRYAILLQEMYFENQFKIKGRRIYLTE